MEGYIINLGSEILFQPCESDTIGFWQSLDNRSFSIWCNQINDQYCEAINNLGDSAKVRLLIDSGLKYYDTQMTFFYCSLEIDMQFLSKDENSFSIYKKPQYEILYNQKKFPLKGFYTREWVRKLIPKDRKNLLLMYKYYRDKNYVVPNWLEKLI